ncbi:microsomal glutathione S-transferase 3-like [Populus alba x Populus x berolinensis]|uniref:Glutathione S-transferase 3, mitochondrial n=1 Tax=Populus alba x Populus x berolinensis TaxID=444605 RepID=A0AAD6LH99_9ROSI|nr:microsomal glutathione S-transferase 3-like [Populus alba x Populus x berolinensis]
MAGVEMFPRGFGNVAFVLVAYCFLNFWMGFQVGKARKKYNVPYPTLYAIESENKDAKLFNCVQRGHQNSLELMPVFFLLMVLGGIRHPCACVALGSIYTVTRFFYFTGYATGDPKKRLTIGHMCLTPKHKYVKIASEIWALAFDRAYGVHNFIRNQSSSRKVLGPVTEKPVAAPPATSQATEGTKKSKERS